VCVCVCGVCVCVGVRARARMCLCTCVCMYIHIYIYTHTYIYNIHSLPRIDPQIERTISSTPAMTQHIKCPVSWGKENIHNTDENPHQPREYEYEYL